MVAISLYRGNMHCINPDVPRQWVIPPHEMSIKTFRHLFNRREKALFNRPSPSSLVENSRPPLHQKLSDFVMNQNPRLESELKNGTDSDVKERLTLELEPMVSARVLEKGKEKEQEKAKAKELEKEQVKEKEKEKEKEKDANAEEKPDLQDNNKLDNVDDKEKHMQEVEERLNILKDKKHKLVQALKLICNAEEEIKRRSSHVLACRPPLPLQTDVSNDSGSMTRHATPRTGSDANVIVDIEGVEVDDALNHNTQSRALPRLNSTSPSAESALRRPPYFQHNMASHASRAAMVAAGSPSRFAPPGNNLVNPSNLLTVSLSGTNYVASSPSPAASGGTSGSRDVRHPSPWH